MQSGASARIILQAICVQFVSCYAIVRSAATNQLSIAERGDVRLSHMLSSSTSCDLPAKTGKK